MTSPAKCAAFLLPFLLSGCTYHRNRPMTPVSFAPNIEPMASLDITSLDPPPALALIPAQPILNMREQTWPIKEPTRRKPTATRSPEEATNLEPAPAVNAIGTLSSGNPGTSRQDVDYAIASIERGLNSINRNLDDGEQKTADHIREFLKQAKAAIVSGDVEGAHTLTEKAKALLDQLSK